MSEITEIVAVDNHDQPPRRPPWLRAKINDNDTYREIGRLLNKLSLNTVCQSARCPNIWECWGQHRTVTFMIMGDICTRACRYCAVTKGKAPAALDINEPQNIAKAVQQLGLAHVVVTSVDRDDLADYGAAHFIATINYIRELNPKCRIEILTPDFQGNEQVINKVLAASPTVFGHNLETVANLFAYLRPQGSYTTSLKLLAQVAYHNKVSQQKIITKSGIMVGLGEEISDILSAMEDLREHSCEILTIGQYLNPTKQHACVKKIYTPDEFIMLRNEGLKRGFYNVISGPLVRSSYHAHEHVIGATSTGI
ncbi:MAG: lipoyl synthase [Deltaproteobacteria bacterium]|nr:lipoyl synthase [Deltaproteobacteria bacterium]